MTGKPLVWLHGEVKTPPFSARARAEAGYLLRMLQEASASAYRSDAVVILEIFEKKTRATPKHVLEAAKRRWKKYLEDQEED